MFLRKTNLLLSSCFYLFLSQAHADTQVSLGLETQWLAKPPSDSALSRSLNSVTLSIENKSKLSENWRLRFEPWARAQTPNDISEKNPELNFRESLIEYKFDQTRVQLGSLIKAWEGTDGVNPMDIATQKNFSSPLRSSNLGSVGIWLQQSWDFGSLEVLFLPAPTTSIVPGLGSGWWPREYEFPIEIESTKLLLPANPRYEFLQRQTVNLGDRNNYGARLKLTGEKTDFSLAYFLGVTQSPSFQPTISGSAIGVSEVQLANPIQIKPVDDLRESFAAGFNYQFDEWIFRAAGRKDQPKKKEQAVFTGTTQIVVAAEKILNWKNKTWVVVLEAISTGADSESFSALSTLQIFKQAAILAMKIAWSDTQQVQVSLLQSFSSNSTIFQLEDTVKLKDNLSLTLGLDDLSGPQTSLVGLWSSQSKLRAGLELTY